MESKNFLKDVYDDFFGIEKIKEQNEKLRQELGLTEEYPAIELEREKDVGADDSVCPSTQQTKEDKDNKDDGTDCS